MVIELVAKNKLLFMKNVSKLEYDQLKLTSTISGFDYKKRKRIPWTKTYISNASYLPAGFWHKVASLHKSGWTVQMPNLTNIVDNSVSVESINDWIDSQEFKDTRIQPRWYQRKALYFSQKYAISRGDFATGAGKTLICYLVARYILENKLEKKSKKVLMVVPSVQLVTQTRDNWLDDYQVDDYIKLDIISGSVPQRNPDGNVVLGNIDSLRDFPPKFFEQFGAVIFDEAHKLTTDTYKYIFGCMLHNELDMVYSVSGSWYDPDTKGDFACEAVSGPILMRVPAHLLMAEGSLTPCRIFEIPFEHTYETSEQYYNHPDCQVTDHKNIRNHFELNFIRAQQSRFDIIMSTVTQMQHNQLLLFKSVEYARMFAARIAEQFPDKQVHVIVGDVSTPERERIKAITESNDNVIICATYGTMSTGVSINNLFGLHMVEPAKSFIWVRQSIGRTLRLHASKSEAIICAYVDIFKKYNTSWAGPRENIMFKHMAHRMGIYEQQKFVHTKLPTIKMQ